MTARRPLDRKPNQHSKSPLLQPAGAAYASITQAQETSCNLGFYGYRRFAAMARRASP